MFIDALLKKIDELAGDVADADEQKTGVEKNFDIFRERLDVLNNSADKFGVYSSKPDWIDAYKQENHIFKTGHFGDTNYQEKVIDKRLD